MECYYDVAQNCFFSKTRTVSRYVTNLYTKALKETGITPVQYSMSEEKKIYHLSSVKEMDKCLEDLQKVSQVFKEK